MSEGTMADASELANVPAIEQQTPEVEKDEPQTLDDTLDADAIEGEEQQDEGAEPEVEFVEVERNGKRYSVPKELEGELMMNADYTRKTQETAALRKTLDARAEEIEQRAAATEEELEARSALRFMEQQLHQWSNIDWNRLEHDDPMLAQSEWRKYQQMKALHGETSTALEAKQKERSAQAEREFANRLRETAEFASKHIPGFSADLDNKIAAFALSELGHDEDTLKRAYNPRDYKAMYLAYIGHQALSRQNAKPSPTPQAKPLTTIASKAAPAARKSLGEMSMEEYAAHRNRQEAAARARASR
jgi:hypothetical protein